MNLQTFRFKFLPFIFSGILLFALCSTPYAQHGNIWAFGNRAGIDFNTNPPKPITINIGTSEGSASICDDNGQLLFYTDGTYVWNRNNSIMQNGSDLTGTNINITASTTQGALIVPVPGNQDQYYIFSLGQYNGSIPASPYVGKLYYSIVDMTLNSGLGGVVTTGKLLDSLLTEHMTAVSGNDCNVWLLVLSRADTTLKAYNIDVNGINPRPVVSVGVAGGGIYSGILGSIDVSPDRSKLAVAQGNLVLYDFNVDAGSITNPQVLDLNGVAANVPGYYGVCFSPGNTKLYASTDLAIQQFDVSLADTTAIRASKIILGAQSYGAIKRAPDGKVYSAHLYSPYLNVINQPDLAGTACQFVVDGFSLSPGTLCHYGLPNSGTLFKYKKIYSTTTDSTLCSGPRTLKAANISGQNYVWEDSTLGATRIVDTPGVYWVRYLVPVNTPCKYEDHVDTFKVIFRFTTKDIYTTTTDSGWCRTDTIVMQAGNLNGINYIWEDGSTGKQRKINQTGIYQVSYRVDSLCENHVDSFIITYPEKDYKVSFSTDTLVCQDELVTFQNTSDAHFNSFYWLFGDQNSSVQINPQHVYTRSGNYQGMLIGHIGEVCPDTAYQTIVVDSVFPVRFFKDRDSICMGESITFHTVMASSMLALQWHFGDGMEMATDLREGIIHHAYEATGILPVMLTARYRACPDTSFTDTVYVSALPKVHLGADTNLCLHGFPIVLKNLQELPTEAYHTFWSTGDTTETLKVAHPGTYSLTVRTKPLDCSTTETVTINKDCYIDIPNAFTPNGDGVNDYFFPRKLLTQNVASFRMQVFNRWGEKVFETFQAEGRGWDGRLMGKEQPGSVYIYLIDVTFDHGRQERYEGNVTLIR